MFWKNLTKRIGSVESSLCYLKKYIITYSFWSFFHESGLDPDFLADLDPDSGKKL